MSQLQVTGEAKIRDIQGPVVANSGVITALDGAASQYVRGDGTLADFPTSTGGGSSVSYYLNGSVNQGTFAGSTYYEMSKTPIIGAGTDFAVSTNGLVAQFITDANDPDLLEVPGGNFNVEFYFSVSNNTGNPTVYAELYKYDGTTFTLLGSSVAVPESLNQGTTIAPYYFAIPVATAALALTDRIAIRIYANVDGRTVTLHTENSHLCQVVTTFSKGMVSLNNLTDQSQYLTTGTSGTNFNIVSSGDTHTFNLPVASATNTGKLSSTDWSTFNAKQPAGNYVTLDTTQTISGLKTFSAASVNIAPTSGDGGILNLKRGAYTGGINDYTSLISQGDNFGIASLTSSSNRSILFDFASITSGILRTYTLPNLSGTLALLEGTQTFSGDKLFNGSVDFNNSVDINSGLFIRNNVIGSTLYTSFTITKASSTQTLSYLFSTGFASNLLFNDAANYSYTFPASSGTIALTSDISYPVTSVFGRTGAVVATEGDYSLTQLSDVTITTPTNGQVLKYNGTAWVNDTDANTGTVTSVGLSSATSGVNIGSSPITTSGTITLAIATASGSQNGLLSSTDWTTFNNKQNAITLTTTGTSGAATLVGSTLNIPNYGSALSGYLPLSGGTLTGGLNGTTATFSGLGTFYQLTMTGATAGRLFYAQTGGVFSQSGNLVWNNTTEQLGVGTPNPSAVVTAFSTNAATQLKAAGTAPAITFSNTLTSASLACVFGLATANNHFITGTAAGDMAIANQSTSPGAIIFGTDTFEKMRITSGGNVGFNGSSDVANVNDKFSLGYFNSNYGWLQTWSSTPLYLNKLGNAVYAGSVRLDTLSDERVKDNIQPIENALSKVLSITGKKFHLKDEDESKIRYGFIAQELEGVLDEFVIQTDITFKHKELEVKNVKSIENWASSWAALLVEAIKEQQAQIEELKAKIK